MTSCPNITKTTKYSAYNSTKTVSQLLETLNHPTSSAPKSSRHKIDLDIELIRSQMKKKWRGNMSLYV